MRKKTSEAEHAAVSAKHAYPSTRPHIKIQDMLAGH